MKKENVFRDITLFSVVDHIALLLYALVYVFILKHLGPVRYGVWVIFSSALYGVKFIGMGTSEGMVRQVSFYASQDKKDYIRELQQTTFWWGMFLAFFISAVAFGISFFAVLREYSSEVRLFSVAFLLSYIYFFVYQRLMSENRITVLAYYYLSGVLIGAFLYALMVYHYEIKGLLLAVIIKTGFLLFFAWYKKIFDLSFLFHMRGLKELLFFGLPMMLLSICFYVMTHIDNMFIFFFLGKEPAGLYGIAALLSRALLYFPFSVAIVLFPKIMARYGEFHDSHAIEDFYMRPIRFFMFLAPFVIGIICIMAPAVLFYAVPKYMGALNSIRILAVGSSAAVFLLLATYMLIAFNRQMHFLILSVCLLSFGVFLDGVVIMRGYGIDGVAYATASIFFIQSVIWNIAVLNQLGYSIKENTTMIVKMYSPLVYCVFILIPIFSLPPFVDSVILNVCAQLCVFCILMLPCIMKIAQYKDHLCFKDYVCPRMRSID